MQSVSIVRKTEVINTPRVMQLSGMFDIPPQETSEQRWDVSIPLNEKPWNIGLIVGPSGCGKTTIASEIFGDKMVAGFEWDDKKSILDAFPKSMGIKDISAILNSVGFSSPPSWFKPYKVLSNGEKFRVDIARALAESPDLCVIDEFTSVVDRTVAQIGSAAVAKTIRRMKKQFVAVSCHYDIEEWLQPDWVYRVHDNSFHWRSLRQRPEIELEIIKVDRKAWEMFKRYHYLTAQISNAAQCFVAFWKDIPVAFYSYLHFQNNRLKKTKRGHRMVCLPDYQGVGMGLRMEEHVASCLVALGFDYIGAASHPARIAYCANSPRWRMIAKPNISRNKGNRGKKNSTKHAGRLTTTFRYCGPAARVEDAERLLNG
jgi:energy-coupling factor transporter ATP-binding protein EcfA2